MRNKELDIYRGMTIIYIFGVIHTLYWSGLVSSEYKSLFLVEMPLIFFIMGASFSFGSSNLSLEYMTKRFLRCMMIFALYSLTVLILNILLFSDLRNQMGILKLIKVLIDPNLVYNMVPYLNGYLWFIPIYLLFIPIVPLIWFVYKSNQVAKYTFFLIMGAVILIMDITKFDSYYTKTICFYSIYIYFGFFYQEWVLSRRNKVDHLLIVILSILMLFAIKDKYGMDIQANKLPPNFMFLVYTFMVFNILVLIKELFLLAYEKIVLLKKLVDNYSKNNFILYFWHSVAYLFIYVIISKLPKDSIIVQLLSQPIIYGMCIVAFNVINGNIFHILENITVFSKKQFIVRGGGSIFKLNKS